MKYLSYFITQGDRDAIFMTRGLHDLLSTFQFLTASPCCRASGEMPRIIRQKVSQCMEVIIELTEEMFTTEACGAQLIILVMVLCLPVRIGSNLDSLFGISYSEFVFLVHTKFPRP